MTYLCHKDRSKWEAYGSNGLRFKPWLPSISIGALEIIFQGQHWLFWAYNDHDHLTLSGAVWFHLYKIPIKYRPHLNLSHHVKMCASACNKKTERGEKGRRSSVINISVPAPILQNCFNLANFDWQHITKSKMEFFQKHMRSKIVIRSLGSLNLEGAPQGSLSGFVWFLSEHFIEL